MKKLKLINILIFVILMAMTMKGAIASTSAVTIFDFNVTHSDGKIYSCTDAATIAPNTSRIAQSCGTTIADRTSRTAYDFVDSSSDWINNFAANGWQLFYFKINVSTTRLNSLNWSYKGASYAGSPQNMQLYAWNVTANQWSNLINYTGAMHYNGSIITGIDFVNSSNYTHFMVYYQGQSTAAQADTDYVSLTLDYYSNVNPTISSNASFINYSSSHQLNATVSAQDLDGYADIVSVNYTVTNGTCQNLVNITSGNLFNTTWNCSGKALTEFNLTIGFTDSSGAYVSSTGTNTYPNQLGTIASVTINNTAPADDDDIACLNGSVADVDGDSTTLKFDWKKGAAWQGIDSVNLSAGHTTTDDVWQCRVSVYDGYQWSNNITSDTVSIASSLRSPTLNWTNATTVSTQIISSSSYPTNNDSQVNLSIIFDDANADAWTAYFCKANAIDSNGCVGDAWCNSTINSTNKVLACNFSVAGLTSSSYAYYAFIVDNSSMISSSLTNTFNINHPPVTPLITYPSNNTWYGTNWTWINFSSSDSDGDLRNYTLWCNNSLGDILYATDINVTYFNYSNLNESIYNCIIQPEDQHAYAGANSSTYSFKIDYTDPVIDMTYTDKTAYSTSEQVIFYLNCSDSFSGIDTSFTPTVYLNLSDGTEDSTTLTYYSGDLYRRTGYSLLGIDGTYQILWSTCMDAAGNVVNTTSTYTFTASTPVVGGGGGGGGGIVKPPESLPQQPKLESISSKCGDNICDADEDPLSCPVDCRLFSLEDMFCWPIPECGNWKNAWFTNLLIIGIVGGLIYVQYKRK